MKTPDSNRSCRKRKIVERMGIDDVKLYTLSPRVKITPFTKHKHFLEASMPSNHDEEIKKTVEKMVDDSDSEENIPPKTELRTGSGKPKPEFKYDDSDSEENIPLVNKTKKKILDDIPAGNSRKFRGIANSNDIDSEAENLPLVNKTKKKFFRKSKSELENLDQSKISAMESSTLPSLAPIGNVKHSNFEIRGRSVLKTVKNRYNFKIQNDNSNSLHTTLLLKSNSVFLLPTL